MSIEVLEWFPALVKRRESALEHPAVQPQRGGGKRFKPLDCIHARLEMRVVTLNEIVGFGASEPLFPHAFVPEQIIPSVSDHPERISVEFDSFIRPQFLQARLPRRLAREREKLLKRAEERQVRGVPQREMKHRSHVPHEVDLAEMDLRLGKRL